MLRRGRELGARIVPGLTGNAGAANGQYDLIGFGGISKPAPGKKRGLQARWGYWAATRTCSWVSLPSLIVTRLPGGRPGGELVNIT
jgi:hypothetical protein